MGEDFTRSAGSAALGARLRRLSEQIDGDAARVYAVRGIRFEQRWFGPLNQIVRNGPSSVGEIAERLGITHVSVSQSIRSLEKAGLVKLAADPHDGRRRLVGLSAAGRALAADLADLWRAFDQAATALNDEAGDVIRSLDRLEEALSRQSLFERIGVMVDRRE